MMDDPALPPPGMADVRITAATPEVARQVALSLRALFASTEQRSYPAGANTPGTCLLLSVDTRRRPGPVEHAAHGPRVHPVTGARRIW
jgi:hypothetical protein